jgi:hypothetical protein
MALKYAMLNNLNQGEIIEENNKNSLKSEFDYDLILFN